MTDSYKVGYSVDALDDLREIYSYIANELLVPETAAAQLGRIRKEARSLDFMPARYTLVEWEPWRSDKVLQRRTWKNKEPGRNARMDSLTKTLEFTSRW